MKLKAPSILAVIPALISLSLPACARMHAEEKEHSHEEHQKIVVTSPEVKDVVITQPYVCQIHSRRHIEVRALDEGYLEAITVKEGQAVKQGDVMFKVIPILYRTKYEAEKAEAELAEIKFEQTKKLASEKTPVVSQTEVLQYKAELNRALAKMKQAEAELEFTKVKAPFDGIIDRLRQQHGSLVKKEEILTTLSDNDVMWVYFNVPEARYLEFKAREGKTQDISRLKLVDSRVELVLANGTKFEHATDNTVTVEGTFNNQTGNIQFRADFPNPDRLLRHGQTGTILVHHTMHRATVIPQRATFELLGKRYVWVVGEDHVVHQRLLTIEHELEDIFVIKDGLDAKDKIVLEGVRQVHEGGKVEYEFREPEVALKNQKFYAE